jgi:DNA-binding NtrC family response regulator
VLPRTPLILIVEDNRSVQAALAEALRLDDRPLLAVASVADSEDALQRLGSAGIKLVLIGIHLTARLQTYEGYQLYERWHRGAPHLSFLSFLFKRGSPGALTPPAVRRGAVRFLAKPFSLGELWQAVREELHSAGRWEC